MKVKKTNFVYGVSGSDLLDARHHNVDEILNYMPNIVGDVKTIRVDYLIWKWIMDNSQPVDTLGQIVDYKNEREKATLLLTDGLVYKGISIRHHQEFSTAPQGLLC
jgi:hypothetical protein